MSTESTTSEIVHEELGSDLGAAIADLPEYERFLEAKAAVEGSPEAQERVREFEQTREAFTLARQTGSATEEDLQEFQAAQEALNDVPEMETYLDAQNELDARLERIEDAISADLAIDFGEHVGSCCED